MRFRGGVNGVVCCDCDSDYAIGYCNATKHLGTFRCVDSTDGGKYPAGSIQETLNRNRVYRTRTTSGGTIEHYEMPVDADGKRIIPHCWPADGWASFETVETQTEDLLIPSRSMRGPTRDDQYNELYEDVEMWDGSLRNFLVSFDIRWFNESAYYYFNGTDFPWDIDNAVWDSTTLTEKNYSQNWTLLGGATGLGFTRSRSVENEVFPNDFIKDLRDRLNDIDMSPQWNEDNTNCIMQYVYRDEFPVWPFSAEPPPPLAPQPYRVGSFDGWTGGWRNELDNHSSSGGLGNTKNPTNAVSQLRFGTGGGFYRVGDAYSILANRAQLSPLSGIHSYWMGLRPQIAGGQPSCPTPFWVVGRGTIQQHQILEIPCPNEDAIIGKIGPFPFWDYERVNAGWTHFVIFNKSPETYVKQYPDNVWVNPEEWV